MKKIIALLLVLCVSFCLVACKNETTSSDLTSEGTQTEVVESDSDKDETSEVSEPEETDSDADSKPTNNVSSNTVTSKPVGSTTTAHTHEFSKATCTEAAKCSCGATEGAALGHKYVNHKCSVCKADESGYKVVESSDKTFSVILPESLASKCKIEAYAEWDGVQISVKDAGLGMYAENVPVFLFTSVHESVQTYEADWKKKGDSVIFDPTQFSSLEDMGFRLKKTAHVKDGFTIYCQYIDGAASYTGNKAVVKELLDNESKIEIIFN